MSDEENTVPKDEPEKPKPAPFIDPAAPIVSPLPESGFDLPKLTMPVAGVEQFEQMAEGFMFMLRSKQQERADIVTQKIEGYKDYFGVEIGQDDEGSPIRLIMTTAERDTYHRLTDGLAMLHPGEMSPFTQGTWTNMVRNNGQVTAIGSTTSGKSDPSSRLREALGLGDGRQAPLFNSGFSISLKTPSNLDQLFFQTQLASEKIEQTRRSLGFSLISTSGYMKQLFTDWVLKYADKSSAGTVDPIELKQRISILDIDPLAIAISSSIWAKGYPMERQCTKYEVKDEDPENESGIKVVGCGTTTTSLLNINRMVINRTDRLDENQIIQVSKRSGHIDIKTIEGYRNNICSNVPRVYDIQDKVVIGLRIPTIYQDERVCTAWLDRLTARARTISMGGSTKEARESYMLRANAIGRLMEYGSWIEWIGLRNNPEDEPEILFRRAEVSPKDIDHQRDADERIDSELENMSGNEILCAEILKTVRKFIEDVSISWVVISKDPCPHCGTTYASDVGNELNHPDLISISAIEFFITLLGLKIQVSGG